MYELAISNLASVESGNLDWLLLMAPYLAGAAIIAFIIFKIFKQIFNNNWHVNEVVRKFVKYPKSIVDNKVKAKLRVLLWLKRVNWFLMASGIAILWHFYKAGGPNKGGVVIVNDNRFFEMQLGLSIFVVTLLIALLLSLMSKLIAETFFKEAGGSVKPSSKRAGSRGS